MVDQVTHHTGMLLDRVSEAGWTLREPETQVVRGDATELVAQRDDDVAVQEAPGRVAVAEHDRHTIAASRALVDVVHAAPCRVEPVRRERVQRRIWGEVDSHCAPPVPHVIVSRVVLPQHVWDWRVPGRSPCAVRRCATANRLSLGMW
ncbi:hypothetical protein I552_6325 [Mycobacterium xenopi 3993]|nr:hypothetical protein I552_6325 [Mycobacterium xenopi 3993]